MSSNRKEPESSWPPRTQDGGGLQMDTFELVQLAQRLSTRVSVLQKAVVQQQRETEHFRHEAMVLRTLAGLPVNGGLPLNVIDFLVTCLSNATVVDHARGDCARPSLLQRIGIQAWKRNVNIAALQTSSPEFLSAVQENDRMRANILDAKARLIEGKQRNQFLCNNIQKLNIELQRVTDELKACHTEKEQIRESFRTHLVQHETNMKERDLEIQKSHRLITELRGMTEQQVKEITQQSEIISDLKETINEANKTFVDVRKHSEKSARDIENKNNAIKQLQKILHDNKTALQESLTAEKKKAAKKLADVDSDNEKLRRTIETLEADIQRAEQERVNKASQLGTVQGQLSDMTECVEQLTKDLEVRDKKIRENQDMEAKFHHDVEKLRASESYKEAAFSIIQEQLRFLLDKVAKVGDGNFLLKTWQTEWLRFCRSNSLFVKYAERIGTSTFPGLIFSDPRRQNGILRSRRATSPVMTNMARSTEPSQGQLTRPQASKMAASVKSRGSMAEVTAASVKSRGSMAEVTAASVKSRGTMAEVTAVKRVRKSTALHATHQPSTS